MPVYDCTDGNCVVSIEANDEREAAQEYANGGDYQQDQTCWVTVWVTEYDEDGDPFHPIPVKIAVEAREPKCSEDEHFWESPWDIVGGLKENPGVFGSGGGVKMVSICSHCGCKRTVDTWAYDPFDGEQGLTSVEYEKGLV